MKGAIFFSGKYGSTEQYAQWISEETGLPVFDIKDPVADPTRFDFLVLGSSVQFYKLTNRKWVNRHLEQLKSRAKFLFSVSGAGPGPKLDGWVTNSLPESLLSEMKHTALPGKLDHADLSWGLRLIMKIGAMLNPDPEASKDERHGFDYMDRSCIDPLVRQIKEFQSSVVPVY